MICLHLSIYYLSVVVQIEYFSSFSTDIPPLIWRAKSTRLSAKIHFEEREGRFLHRNKAWSCVLDRNIILYRG